jgi:hypothetical protein
MEKNPSMEGRFMSMVLQPKASIIKKPAVPVVEEAPAAESKELRTQ